VAGKRMTVLGGCGAWPAAGQARSGYLIPMHVPHMVQAGPEDAHALHISTPAGFAELVARTGTPAHLAADGAEFDADLFMAVTTELGDVALGPTGTTPAELDGHDPA
jgi:hypothetical protein